MERLVLVRHGRSAHVHAGGTVDHTGLQGWRDAYDAAGIDDADLPPPALVKTISGATRILASDLPRAVASAERLSAGRPVEITPLLRESPLEIPRLRVRLPLIGWALAIHASWLVRLVRGVDPDEADRSRAAAAAEWLEAAARDDVTVVAVTHGVFRRALGQELVRRGWTSTGRHGGYRHWSAWWYHRAGRTV